MAWALEVLAGFGVSIWDPRAGGTVAFSHGRGGFGCAEGDFPPAPRLASFKGESRGAKELHPKGLAPSELLAPTPESGFVSLEKGISRL